MRVYSKKHVDFYKKKARVTTSTISENDDRYFHLIALQYHFLSLILYYNYNEKKKDSSEKMRDPYSLVLMRREKTPLQKRWGILIHWCRRCKVEIKNTLLNQGIYSNCPTGHTDRFDIISVKIMPLWLVALRTYQQNYYKTT